ncbi:MAG TPA: hypothetical protein VIF82_01805 [Burkholderiaceae bacterium]|jgi:hypothetical protein
MIPFSILDLSPLAEGSNAAPPFRITLDFTQHGKRWSDRRFYKRADDHITDFRSHSAFAFI